MSTRCPVTDFHMLVGSTFIPLLCDSARSFYVVLCMGSIPHTSTFSDDGAVDVSSKERRPSLAWVEASMGALTLSMV